MVIVSYICTHRNTKEFVGTLQAVRENCGSEREVLKYIFLEIYGEDLWPGLTSSDMYFACMNVKALNKQCMSEDFLKACPLLLSPVLLQNIVLFPPMCKASLTWFAPRVLESHCSDGVKATQDLLKENK